MALVKRASTDLSHPLDSSQTLRASTALLRKIESDKITQKSTTEKRSLLADAEDDEAADDVPIWLILTTKKHIIDKKRLKPGKVLLPHPYLDTANQDLRICLVTADPQRTYKELIAHPTFPLDLAKRIGRVIGLTKLKSKYKSFESRRQLFSEYDVFLADDRIITHLPQVLGKIFYKGGSKRPVPVSLEGKRQSFDEQGSKRRKLSEGGKKVVKADVNPADVAREIERTLSCALVHLAPSTTTAVKVGKSSMEPQQIQDNVEAVTAALVDRYVPQKWSNVRAVHIKSPTSIALPIWMTEELWADENEVLDEPLPLDASKKSKKRKKGILDGGVTVTEEGVEVIEVPGPDGKMRRIERTSAKQKAAKEPLKPSKKRKNGEDDEVDAKAAERAQKAARKEALKKQKAEAKDLANGVKEGPQTELSTNGGVKVGRKTRTTAADLV